jgi:hypothetical protein
MVRIDVPNEKCLDVAVFECSNVQYGSYVRLVQVPTVHLQGGWVHSLALTNLPSKSGCSTLLPTILEFTSLFNK